MRIKEFKEALLYLFKAKVPAIAWGPHGIGKSSVPEQVCKDNGFGIYNCRVGNFADAGDLLGLADFQEINGVRVATRFYMPDWLKAANDFCEENPEKLFIVFWDEINRARKDLRVPLFQIILDNKLHTHNLHPNIRHIAAANPNTDDYEVVDMSDKAWISRWCHLKLAPSVGEWLDHQKARGCDPSILNFIQLQPGMLAKEGAEFNLNFVEPDRRNWEKYDDLKKVGTPYNILQELGYGLVGIPAMIAYEESQKTLDQPLSASDIFDNYPKFQDKVKKFSDNDGVSRTDILTITCNNIEKEVETRQKNGGTISKEEGENLSEFLLDIPLGVSFAAAGALWLHEIARPNFEKNDKLKEKIKTARNMK